MVISVVSTGTPLVLVGDTVTLAVADAALFVVGVAVGVSVALAIALGLVVLVARMVGGVVPVPVATGVGFVVATAVLVAIALGEAVYDGADVGEEVSPSTTIVPVGYCGNLSM